LDVDGTDLKLFLNYRFKLKTYWNCSLTWIFFSEWFWNRQNGSDL